MPPDSLIDRAIEAVADGAPVDWAMLDSQAPDDERELLKCLRILDGISELHRSTQDEVDPAEDSLEESPPKESPTKESIARSTVTGPAPLTEDRSDWWGRYRLIERVGEGSFGNVYRAWDPELEREIAIKILHRRVSDSHLKERLLREGRALARVRDHNVVSVFGIESHGDRVGLCMEFVPGETLEAVLKTQGPRSAHEAVLVGEDVCRALAAVHGAGFVHRDVKARNVMREQSGRIVLMDFGTGREAEELKEAGQAGIAGTPMYMAPEVLAGLPASESSDVYSTGVLLYYLVTSNYPVEGRTLEELRAAHMQGRRRPLSDRRTDLPLPFIQLVDRALSPDPDQRYTNAGTLLEALEQFSKPADPRPISRYLSIAGLAIVGTTGLMTGLGILSSRLFNFELGRSDFVSETALDWFKWGAKSCLGPAVFLLLAMLAIALLIVSRHVLVTVSGTARRVDGAARLRLIRAAHRLHLDEVSVLASCVLLLSTVALLLAWWAFSPLFEAYLYVLSARAEDLALLAPDYHWYHNAYRETLSWIVILSVLAWYPVARLAAFRRERVNRGMLAGGAAVVFLGLALLDFPYRVLLQNQFVAVIWNGGYCYVIGERRDDLLLFCPGLQPPRSRIVSKRTDLAPTGVTESIFTRFSRQPGTPGPGTH